jgi:hypothetical protein
LNENNLISVVVLLTTGQASGRHVDLLGSAPQLRIHSISEDAQNELGWFENCVKVKKARPFER